MPKGFNFAKTVAMEVLVDSTVIDHKYISYFPGLDGDSFIFIQLATMPLASGTHELKFKKIFTPNYVYTSLTASIILVNIRTHLCKNDYILTDINALVLSTDIENKLTKEADLKWDEYKFTFTPNTN